MAVIGMLGDIVFSVSKEAISTFNNLKWDSSVKYATHDRHLQDELLEFMGPAADTITFDMYFSVFLGIDPMQEIVKLLNAERKGEVMRLVIGTKAYGKNKWVITGTGKLLERFDNKGRLLVSKVNVSLKAYAGR